MVTVIKQYQGTIDEFIGDAIFVLFGAPVWQEDDAERGVACAVAMQIAMVSVNEENRKEGLPEVEMGIGVHTGQVVVGNIGSAERMKYGVVGSHVNLTSRIQSYTTGGQILISETTRQEVGQILKIGREMEVNAKGIDHPITLYEVLGLRGRHNSCYLLRPQYCFRSRRRLLSNTRLWRAAISALKCVKAVLRSCLSKKQRLDWRIQFLS